MLNDYGNKIKYFRKRASLSQFELELKAGFANGVICRIEKGLTNPSKETLHKIAQVLNLSQVELAYLFGINLAVTNQLTEYQNIQTC